MLLRLLSVLFLVTTLHAKDWPQWRGPLRNGVVLDSPKLLDTIPAAGLRELWESEAIPANDEGGLASPAVADGKVFIAVVWHRDVPSETRQIDDLVLRQLGFQPLNALTKEIIDAMEKTRAELAPTLRGGKLDEFITQWINERLDKKQQQLYTGYISNRFKKGPLAMPLDVLEALNKNAAHVFASEAEMKQWLAAQGWAEDVQQRIVAAVPPTKRIAEDSVVCLDLATGKTLWKTTAEGRPVGREASATPCVADGKVFAIGSTRVWCVDTVSGEIRWEKPLAGKRGVGGSPVFSNGLLIVNTDALIAFDAATGEERWRQQKQGGGNSSPIVWNGLVIVNGRNALHAVDLATGTPAWSAPGGGDATPAMAGDLLAVQTRKPALGLVGYRVSPTGATALWTFPLDALRTQSSPILHDGLVYLLDDDASYCLDATTGAVRWKGPAQATIASPVLADGKLWSMANNGNTVLALKATGNERVELGKATVRAQWVPSPCVADGRLVLRMKDKAKAWSLIP